MVHAVVLRANTVKSNTGKGEKNKNQKYHEAVEMATAEAISRPLCTNTSRTCMLTSSATVLHETHRKWGVNKEMEGWEMGSRPEAMLRVSIASSCSSPKRGGLSKVKKRSAVLKRAMTEKREKWQNKEWYGKTKSHWRQLAKARMISGQVQSLKASGKRSGTKAVKKAPRGNRNRTR